MNIQTIGIGLLVLGIAILAGYGVYSFLIIEEIPLIVRAGSAVIGIGIAVIIIALVRERMMDIKKENKSN